MNNKGVFPILKNSLELGGNLTSDLYLKKILHNNDLQLRGMCVTLPYIHFSAYNLL